MNAIIVAIVCIAAYVLTGMIINYVTKKFYMGKLDTKFIKTTRFNTIILVALALVAGSFSCGLYFSTGTPSILILSSIFQAAASVSTNIMTSIAVEIFPTTLR